MSVNPAIPVKNVPRKTRPAAEARLEISDRSTTGCPLRRSATAEHREQDRRGGHQHERPRRPALLAALHQREDQRGRRRRQTTPTRSSPAVARPVSGRNTIAATSAASPSGTLIRKITRQPVPNRSASMSEAGEDRPDDRGKPHDRAEREERLRHFLGRGRLLQHRRSPAGSSPRRRRPGATRGAISVSGGRREPAQQRGER